MNRLYWLNDQGDWELVVETDKDLPVHNYVRDHSGAMAYGEFAYAKYPAAPPAMHWTQYVRYSGGIRRAAVRENDIPQPIHLLEILICN